MPPRISPSSSLEGETNNKEHDELKTMSLKGKVRYRPGQVQLLAFENGFCLSHRGRGIIVIRTHNYKGIDTLDVIDLLPIF